MHSRMRPGFVVSAHWRYVPVAARVIVTASLLLAMVLTVTSPLLAQGDPREALGTYAAPHLFGLPTATTTRLHAMGGITACVEDAGFPNPAFAGNLDTSHAGTSYIATDFDRGLRLKISQGWINTPVGSSGGLQVFGVCLTSDAGPMLVPPGPTVLTTRYYEGDFSVAYGRAVDQDWLVGVAVSPVLRSSSKVYHPLTGALLSRTSSEASSGARVGVARRIGEDEFFGAFVDYYKDNVSMFVPVRPGW